MSVEVGACTNIYCFRESCSNEISDKEANCRHQNSRTIPFRVAAVFTFPWDFSTVGRGRNHLFILIPKSSASTTARLRVGLPGSWGSMLGSGLGYHLRHPYRLLNKPTLPFIGHWVYSPRVKRQRHEIEHQLLSAAKVTNPLSCTTTCP